MTPDPTQGLMGALSALDAPATPPATPAVETPAAAAEPSSPPADPIKEIESTAPAPELTGLPIDELHVAPEPKPTEPGQKPDKVSYKLEELQKQTKTLTAEMATERAAKAQLETKLAEIEAKATKADELQKQIEEYEQEMLAVRIEKSREYQEAVKKPTDAIVAKLDKLATKHSIDYDKLAEILDTEDEDAATDKLNSLVSGMDVPVTDIVAITQLRAAYAPIKAKQTELYTKADKVLLELEARGKQQDEASVIAAAEERRKVFPTVAAKVVSSIPEFKDIFDAVTPAVVDTDTTKLDVTTQGYNHLAGLALPKVVAAHRKLQKDNDELLMELASYRKATTAPGQFTQQTGSNPPKDLNQALSGFN